LIKLKKAASPGVKTKAELLVVGATTGSVLRPSAAEADSALDGRLSAHLAKSGFTGSPGDAALFPAEGRLPADAVMVVGLGPEDLLDHEQVRRAAGVAARRCGRYRTVALDLGQGIGKGARASAEGFALGSYVFRRYLSEPPSRAETAVVCGATQADIDRAAIVVEAAEWARDTVNEPPSNRGPAEFLQMARSRAGSGLKVQVFDETALKKNGMNGILTVGKGSDSPPRFATFTYDPAGAKGFLGLVGKGITFDSGGLSLKTSEGMETMKMDCSGAAAVLAAVTALPRLAPSLKVVAAVALAENMPGSRAAKPGDVIRHFGGKTSEVLNTDAEGRLVLADALGWMAAQRPDAMADLATLTGGMVVALGQKVAGVMSNRQDLAAELLAASDTSGEPLWEMPLVDDYRKDLDSSVADIRNISGSRWASPIIGGLFLRDFVGDTPWAHLDIAGPAWSDKEDHYLAKGATGYGVRLLLDWIEQRAASAAAAPAKSRS
jgi:leucyl aminopeptidase